MRVGRLGGILQHLRGMMAPAGDALTDRRLLERFFHDGDQAAFATLVERHGGMVRGVCRRILGEAEADDAFQATFVILASKGRQVRWQESIAGWLWTVAYRAACRARARAARRQRYESEAGRDMHDTYDAQPADDLRDVLNEELARLPDRYRLPLVLCYLEGQTTDQAAAQLSWPRGTVAGRLARAREALRRRLERRHVAPTAVVLTAALAPEVLAAPPAVVAATVQAASMLVLGNPLPQLGLSAAALELTQGVLSDMFRAKLKIATVSLVVLAGLGLGTGKVAHTLFTARAEAAPVPNDVAKAPDKEAAPFAVRKLTLKFDPKQRAHDGRFAIVPLKSEAGATKAVGEFTAKQLVEMVDFTKEYVILVLWSSGGPPFDTLEYQLIEERTGQSIRFYVKPAVAAGAARGQAERIGRDYFVVPFNVTVREANAPAVPQKDPQREVQAEEPSALEKHGVKFRVLKVTSDRGFGDTAFNIFTSEKEAANVVGAAMAKQVAEQVDFTKEKVVQAYFQTSGPPFNWLDYRITKLKGGELMEAEFVIRVPTNGPRGRALITVHQFLAVPNAMRVKAELGVVMPPKDEKEPEAGPKIRKLTIKSEYKAVEGRAGQDNFEILKSEKEADDVCGKEVAAEIAKYVDFTKEKVCFIVYSTSGPPFDTIDFELRTPKGDGPRVHFVKKAPDAKERGKLLKVQRECFAVPRTVPATMSLPK